MQSSRKLSDWERIESVIKWANMTTNYFAHHIGLSRGENLYQIKRGNNGVSRRLSDLITTSFPEVSALWLLTGEGQMFSSPQLTGLKKYHYNLDVEANIRQLPQLQQSGAGEMILLPIQVEYDFSMLYTGRAMVGVTPPNSTLLLKKITIDMLIPGDECVVVTKKIVLLRIVKVDLDENFDQTLRLVSTQKESYGDVILELSDVEEFYKVTGKVLINN